MAIKTLGTALLSLAALQTAAQIHVYVDDDAPHGGDGLSWATAMNDLRDAVQLSENLGEFRGEVRIAGGDYLGDLAAPLEIDRYGGVMSGIVLKGGFAGLAMPAASDTRNLRAFVTTLTRQGTGPIIEVNSAAVLTGPRVLGDGPFAALSSINLIRATTFDGLRFSGDHAISVIAESDAVVVIRDCVFESGGGAPFYSGIRATPASVLIERSEFSGYRTSGQGGAILHTDGSLVLESCDFYGNASRQGGAISTRATALRIDSTRFEANNALIFGSQGDGGAVYDEGTGGRILTDVAFVDNRAGRGGALWTQANEVSIDLGVFTGNTATDTGGALQFAPNGISTCLIMNSFFTDNASSTNGGAVAVAQSEGLHSWYECKFEFNSSAGNGGAVWDASTERTFWNRCDFTSNIAEGEGGAIWMAEPLPEHSVRSAHFTDNVASQGGAIRGHHATVHGSSFLRNEALAGNGGAAYFTGHGSIRDSRYESNRAVRGGAVHGPYTVEDSDFILNSAKGQGGALFGPEYVEDVVCESNRAEILGGAIYEAGEVVRSELIGNSAGARGGAIYNLRRGADLIIQNNHAEFGGGGVRLEGGFELGGSYIVGNTTSTAPLSIGSQVVIDGGDGTVDQCLIASEPSAGTAALAVRLNADLRLQDSLVAGQLLVEAGVADVRGCTIVGEPGSSLPAFYVGSQGLGTLESSVIDAQQAIRIDPGGYSLFVQNFITRGTAGIDAEPISYDILGIISSESPGFLNPHGPDGDYATWHDNDFSLQPRSPMIDIGVGIGIGNGRSQDLSRNRRVENDSGVPDRQIGLDPIDIGAYEFQGTSCLPDMNNDGQLSPTDFTTWIIAYNLGDRFADQNQDGMVSPTDFGAWVINYNNGCD